MNEPPDARTDVASRTPRPAPLLLGLGATAVVGTGLSLVYATTGLGVPCVLRSLTGWDCPFCGGTRMGAALLHGDIATAWSYNPFALVGLGLATVLGLWLVGEQLTGHRGTLASRLTSVADRAHVRLNSATVTAAVAVVLITWTLFRNLVLGPLP